jgi:hypothetical protein
MTPRPDLTELARPFPSDFVERKDGQDYVAHHVVNQRLLSIVGPFDFELVQVIRGDIEAKDPDPSSRSRRGKAGTPAMTGIVVGGIWRLSCAVDGRPVRVEEVGDVGDVHNWPHDGARLKDAASDALKRCAMRLGLGLHLWAQEHYFLDQQLRALAPPGPGPRPVPEPAPEPAPDTELADTLAPRAQVETLLREHSMSWEDLAGLMQRRHPGVTVEDLKGVTKAGQVQAIREVLADHADHDTAGTATA